VRALEHLALDPRAAQDLHRPLQQKRRARMDRRAAVALDDERRDAVAAEQHRRGHPDQAAAGDEDGDVVVHALAHTSPIVSQRRRRADASSYAVDRERIRVKRTRV